MYFLLFAFLLISLFPVIIYLNMCHKYPRNTSNNNNVKSCTYLKIQSPFFKLFSVFIAICFSKISLYTPDKIVMNDNKGNGGNITKADVFT